MLDKFIQTTKLKDLNDILDSDTLIEDCGDTVQDLEGFGFVIEANNKLDLQAIYDELDSKNAEHVALILANARGPLVIYSAITNEYGVNITEHVLEQVDDDIDDFFRFFGESVPSYDNDNYAEEVEQRNYDYNENNNRNTGRNYNENRNNVPQEVVYEDYSTASEPRYSNNRNNMNQNVNGRYVEPNRNRNVENNSNREPERNARNYNNAQEDNYYRSYNEPNRNNGNNMNAQSQNNDKSNAFSASELEELCVLAWNADQTLGSNLNEIKNLYYSGDTIRASEMLTRTLDDLERRNLI